MKCETCGNDYDKAFEVKQAGATHVYDSIECMIQGLAPECPQCGVKIVGHGVEAGGSIYCCAHCAGQEGQTGVRDRA